MQINEEYRRFLEDTQSKYFFIVFFPLTPWQISKNSRRVNDLSLLRFLYFKMKHISLDLQNFIYFQNLGSPKKKKAKRSYHVPSHWEAVNDPTYAGWTPPEG